MKEKLDKNNIRKACSAGRIKTDIGEFVEELEGLNYNKNPDFSRLDERLKNLNIADSLPKTVSWFCRQYVIELWMAYCKDKLSEETDEAAEVFLAACGLLRGFDKINLITKRRLAYANAAFGHNNIVTDRWEKPGSIARLAGNVENAVAEGLIEWIINQAKEDRQFFSAEKLLVQFCEESDEELIERTRFPKPMFVGKSSSLPDMPSLPESHRNTEPLEETASDDMAEPTEQPTEQEQSSVPAPVPGQAVRKPRRWFPFAAAAVVCLAAVILLPKSGTTTTPENGGVQDGTSETVPTEHLPEAGSEYVVNLDEPYSFSVADIAAYAADDYTDPGNAIGSREVRLEKGESREYTVRFRISHTSEDDGAASPARVYFELPSVSAPQIDITGNFYAENLEPDTASDTVSFTADESFYLEYVPGSATIYNGGIGSHVLSDAVMENGVLVGYDKLDGVLPSGEEYASDITIRVRPVFDIQFSVEEMVRRKGDTEWQQSVDAAVGEKVEFLILYTNLSPVTQNGVVIRNELPDNLSYDTGSLQTGTGTTYLYNASHPDGVYNTDDGAVIGTGINIGNYTAGSNAYVIFSAEVVDNSLADGTTKIVSWGQCGVGTTTLQDSASVFVVKEAPTDG